MKQDESHARRAMMPAATSQIGTWNKVATRFGDFHVAAVDGAIVQTALPGASTEQFLAGLVHAHPSIQFRRDETDPLLTRASDQLAEYAQGKRRNFDVPLRPEGTAFQQRVWKALADIPYGETRSYQDVARVVGRPGASRAVGQANHENPVAPFVPCHRVVTSSGTLGGYGGGMQLKRALLELEGVEF
jgi:methylated-DNA-[protein]-cysteine S-methyltransferase